MLDNIDKTFYKIPAHKFAVSLVSLNKCDSPVSRAIIINDELWCHSSSIEAKVEDSVLTLLEYTANMHIFTIDLTGNNQPKPSSGAALKIGPNIDARQSWGTTSTKSCYMAMQ